MAYFFSYFCSKIDIRVSIGVMKFEARKVVSACQRKEPKAQKCLYDEFAPSMLGVCMRYTHSRDEAQDLLHDGFIKVFDSIGQLRDPSAVRAWIKSIMVNVSVNYVKRNKQVLYENLDVYETEEEELDTDNYGIEQVLGAIRRLPDYYRTVFNMREIDEMEYKEMAEIFGQKESSVRAAVTRAKEMLRKELTKK